MQALALAAAGGVALALLFAWSPLLERAFLPVAVALQVTPLIAVAPLLLIYLQPHAAVLACAVLVAFFPILSNASAGLNDADRGLVELFRLKGASRAENPVLAAAALRAAVDFCRLAESAPGWR